MKIVVMCAPADTSPMATVGVTRGVCQKCYTRILVSPSTRNLVASGADCVLHCVACVEKEADQITGHALAADLETIRKEFNAQVPNPFRRANN